MKKLSTQTAINILNAKGIIQQIIGWFLAIICGLFSMVGITQLNDPISVALTIFFFLMTGLGVFLIIQGMKKRKLLKTFQLYSLKLA